MTKAEFLAVIQSRVARVAVGASTVRGRGNRGAATASRAFLIKVDLSAFGTPDEKWFSRVLDRQTEALRRALPLDSVSARSLRASRPPGEVGRWSGVRKLTPEASRRFQEAARRTARERRVARVHVDAVWWSHDRDAEGGGLQRRRR